MARLERAVPPVHEAPADPRRLDAFVAIFGTWMLTGLFLDGWSHLHHKPETFFTPWHAVLYSGFGAALVASVVDGWRLRRRGVEPVPPDRLAILGLGLFALAAVGDFGWHMAFGIERDLSALLSPTHLLLMTGGLLMLSAPLRVAAAQPRARTSFGVFLPRLVALTLATAVASFFTMYLSAWRATIGPPSAGMNDLPQIWGIASILLTTALFVGAAMALLRLTVPPAGSLTVLFGVVAFAMTGLDGFERVALVVPAMLAGGAGDAAIASGRGNVARRVGTIVPLVMWTSWFAAQQAVYHEHWPVNLWTGSVALSVLAGFGLSLFSSA